MPLTQHPYLHHSLQHCRFQKWFSYSSFCAHVCVNIFFVYIQAVGIWNTPALWNKTSALRSNRQAEYRQEILKQEDMNWSIFHIVRLGWGLAEIDRGNNHTRQKTSAQWHLMSDLTWSSDEVYKKLLLTPFDITIIKSACIFMWPDACLSFKGMHTDAPSFYNLSSLSPLFFVCVYN